MEKIEKDFDRDFYMSAQEAKDYGIVDEVIESLEDRTERKIRIKIKATLNKDQSCLVTF